ncbi:MAG: sugar ABC transporter permease [Caldilineaceae bacterium]|nr:sugar ABC transporter permease [Caldilineaceae bacterium]
MTDSTYQDGATTSPRSVPTKRKHRTWLHGDTLIAFIVLLPSIIAVAIFIYGFILWTGFISTVKWNSTIVDYTFVGLKNWSQLFQMERFHWDLRNLVLYAAGFMSQCIIFGFLIAVLIDQKIKGEALFRTIVIFPFAVSAIVTGVAWRWLMQPTTGINLLFENLGLGELGFTWNAIPMGHPGHLAGAGWQFTGYVMALYLAGLRGIPNELREAAAIDGAGAWATYRHVIIPLLMPVTFTAVVLTGMNSIRVFDLVTLLAGPAFSTDTLGFHMYQATFGMNRFSLGAALGFFMIFLSLFLVIPYLRSMRGEVEK